MDTISIRKRLSMIFCNSNKNRTLNVQNPRSSLEAEQVSDTMETMIGKAVLFDSEGALLDTALSAKLITTTEQLLFAED